MEKMVRVGNGQGFWGDNPDAAMELLRRGPVDYLGLDYLAETTLSIMMKQRLRDSRAGFATDFPRFMARSHELLKSGGVRVITNAGGLNPVACREAVAAAVHGVGGRAPAVGVVEGDDLMPVLDELIASGHEFLHMESGRPLEEVRSRVLSANAYLGARPVVDALQLGADVVLAGRITDTALALAPLVHEFGWSWQAWDLLAAGTIAGHILECGAQCTGGNFTRWWEVPDLWDVGYPVLECGADGAFVVTKHPGTGGLVSTATVAEQLVYEMGEPTRYLTPDCTADFTSPRLVQDGANRVRVTGIRGGPAPSMLKVSIAYSDGFKAVGQLVVAGPRAVDKARLAAEIVWKRLARAGVRFPEEDRLEEFLGVGACLPGVLRERQDPPEVVLRLGVRGEDREAVARFGMELAPLVTAGPPGVTGFAGGRPKPQEVVGYWPALLLRDVVESRIRVSVD